MFIDVVDHGGIQVIKVDGEIRTEDARTLGKTFEELLAGGDIDLVLDLAEVGYVTSAGLGHIVSIAAVLRRRGGNLAVCNLQGDVRKAFAVTRIDKVVEVLPSIEAAIEALRRLASENT
jgi:anti-sigma B factor antagonist